MKLARKIYFYDNGIRNALISSFQLFENRQDSGALWENYLMSERKKRNQYQQFYGNSYFWRTKDKQEVDYLEVADGQINAFEFKWNDNRKHKITRTFLNAYPESHVRIIHPKNYDSFLS